MEEEEGAENPWLALPTVSSFDTGNRTMRNGTIRGESTERNGACRQVVSYNPSANLCIESLLQQLCAVFAGDTELKERVYSVIYNKLRKLNVIDDSYNTVEFETLRFQYQDALSRLIKVACAAIGTEGPRWQPSIYLSENKRYERDFHELGCIGSGSFGKVFKAVHRLDENQYAIKKIQLKPGEFHRIRKYLDEVKMLAKLDHPNIVSYKSTWIEDQPTLIPVTEGTSRSSLDIVFEDEPGGRKADVHWQPEENNNNNNNNQTQGGSQESRSGWGSNGPTTSCSGSNYSSEENQLQISLYNGQQSSSWQCRTLYIQMSLSEMTLTEWLSERDGPSSEEVIDNIYTQAVRGLEYIHAKQAVHHDIKPSNILLSRKGSHLHVQLGDFNLACLPQKEGHETSRGTYLYAAPEQLAGMCDPKSDVYSAGIILLELLVPMRTTMEKNKLVKGLQEGVVPDIVENNYPKWVNILPRLVQRDHRYRPSSKELLNMIYRDKDALIHELQSRLMSVESQNKKLKDAVKNNRA